MYTGIHQKLLKMLSTNNHIQFIEVKQGDKPHVDTAIIFRTLLHTPGYYSECRGLIEIGHPKGNTCTVGVSVGFVSSGKGSVYMDFDGKPLTYTNHWDVNIEGTNMDSIHYFIANSITSGLNFFRQRGWFSEFPTFTKQKGFTKGLEKLTQGVGVKWSHILVEKKSSLDFELQVGDNCLTVKATPQGIYLLRQHDSVPVGGIVYADQPYVLVVTSLEELADVVINIVGGVFN